MSTKTSKASRPTDLELMLYADGELEGERLAAVEAYLAQDEAARKKLLAMAMVSNVVREQAQGASKADDIADLVMASIAAEPKKAEAPAEQKVVPARRKPANDNARGLWVIAAFAAAAAAALLLWSRGSTTSDHAVSSSRTPSAPLSAPAPHEEVEHGVEVSAVDFGARMGAVFYVSSDNAAATTTVVWLSDDSSGGDE
jgi:anti-sigma factor RsiW